MNTPQRKLPFALLVLCWLAILLAANGCGVTEPPLPLGQPATDRDAVFSPDGQQLAFEHFQGQDRSGQSDDPEVSGLYIANVDGSGRRLLVPNAGAPAWSPDGRYLLYHTYYELHIYRLELATGAVVQLTSGDNWNRFPAWSPDGRRIAFDSNRGIASGLSYLHLMDPDGTNIRRVTPASDSTGEESFASFRGGGDEVVYAVAVQGSGLNRTGWQIFVADTLGQGARRVVNGLAGTSSPVSSWIAYIQQDRPGSNTFLRLLRADGTGDRLLHADGYGGAGMPFGRPGWSPDGAWIVFSATSRDKSPLWAIRPDGTGLYQISHMPSN